ncbi:MAG: hypothetical protein GXP60_03175 [Epsilonproteobacteria bacterium]|nr:hypothetical protein [Campylobacterota bacterium]
MDKNELWCGTVENFDNCSGSVALVKIENDPAVSEAEKFISLTSTSLKTVVLYIKGKRSLPTLLCMGKVDLIYLDEGTEFFITQNQIEGIDIKFLSVLSSFINRYILTDMIYTGRIISGYDAVKLGIANSITCYPNIVNRIEKQSENLPFALKLLKKISSINSSLSEADARFVERMAFALTFCSSDQKEGMSAFLEKRKPEFKGK